VWTWTLVVVVGYLFGSFPTGYLVGRVAGIDVRKWGSGATGGTNVLRTLGWASGALTAIGDVVKGTLAAYVGYRLHGDWGFTLAGLAAVAGHSYPIWLRFRGGKSVATGAGVLMLLYPLYLGIGLVGFVATIALTRYVSLGSLLAGLVLCLPVWLGDAPLAHKVFAAVTLTLVYARHWENIKRLAAGTESKLGQRAQPRPGG